MTSVKLHFFISHVNVLSRRSKGDFMEIPLNPGFAVAAFLTEWKMSFELDTTQLFLRIKCVFFFFVLFTFFATLNHLFGLISAT